MRIVCPCRSLSVARACAQVDSGPDKAKICSDHRVEADRPWLRAVFGGGKTFLHSLGRKATSAGDRTKSAMPPRTDIVGPRPHVRATCPRTEHAARALKRPQPLHLASSEQGPTAARLT